MNMHHIANYIIGGLALAMALTVSVFGVIVNHHVNTLATNISHQVPEKLSRLAWNDITEEQTIALGEALKALPNKTDVTIFCASTNCVALRNDLDDALQIANWPDSSFEERPVDSESDVGLFVGPPGELANSVQKAIHDATGLQASIVDISDIKGVGIIIGKRP